MKVLSVSLSKAQFNIKTDRAVIKETWQKDNGAHVNYPEMKKL